MQYISTIRAIWTLILRRDVYPRRLLSPSHCLPFDALSGADCAAIATHALRLHESLSSIPAPCDPLVIPMNQSRSVTWVKVICGRWVAAASSDHNTSVVRIWSIASLMSSNDCIPPIAEAYLEGPVANGCWEVERGSLVLALELRPERLVI